MHGFEWPVAHARNRLPALGEVGEAMSWLCHFVDTPNGGFCQFVAHFHDAD